MRLFTNLGSEIFIGTISIIYFSYSKNRIRALTYFIYISFVVYLNGILKNIYHDSRPYWTYSEIEPQECITDFGNPSGKNYLN